MNCTHCNRKKGKKELSQMEVRVAGNVLNVCVCGNCKENLSKIMSFASAFPTASAAARPASAPSRAALRARKTVVPPKKAKASDPKFDGYALSPEEIARTQALRPTIRIPDSPKKRQMDDIDKINSGERCRVFCMAGTPKMRASREKKIMNEAQSKLGTTNIRLVKDDGFEAIFEAA